LAYRHFNQYFVLEIDSYGLVTLTWPHKKKVVLTTSYARTREVILLVLEILQLKT